MSNAQYDAHWLSVQLEFPVQSVIAAADDTARMCGVTWQRVLAEAFNGLVLNADMVDRQMVQTWKTLAAKYAAGPDG